MKIAQFKSDGGPITAVIKGGYAQPAQFTLYLWDPSGENILQQMKGNLNSADGATFTLPLPNDDNDGRLIDVVITFTMIPPINNYSGQVTVLQDNSEIGGDSQSGITHNLTETIKLLVKLVKAGT